MAGSTRAPRIPLPNGWSQRVRSAVIHAISLAHFSLTSTCSWAANSWNARIRLKAENDRLRQELALYWSCQRCGPEPDEHGARTPGCEVKSPD